ncbi:MAG: hypothetical protein Q9207_006195, partial [Kuettlingeria erythrocarpa]
MVEVVLFHLRNLNRTLLEESHSAAPHLCMQKVATSQAYIVFTLVGSSNPDIDSFREAVRFFNLLIDSGEVDFIEDGAFADRLTNFIRVASSSIRIASLMTPDLESDMVELLFAISAKLRQRPTIPEAWFRPGLDTKNNRSSQSGVFMPKSEEFPLVYMLLEYVHRDGKVGDFARTGLLYILELAGRVDRLEKWIIESDLATMMASGIGALYSQLSSKVALSYSKETLPPILAFSGVTASDQPGDAEPIFSAALQANLATFVSFLNFWQDVLDRCPSADIKATLLDHFDFLFLRPLLYPSLVESSDMDSGSSVAVMTYLQYILETLNSVDLIRLMLHYMLGGPAQLSLDSKPLRPSTLARRRKSESLITDSAARIDDPSPDLITLTNVLDGYLRSQNHETVIASLRLLDTILRSWHAFTNRRLMKVQVSTIGRKRLKSVHDQQLDILYSLAEDILSDDAMEDSFESHLHNVQPLLETHPCSAEQLFPPNCGFSETMVLRAPPEQRVLLADDPLLTCLLSLLDSFLINSVVVNLSLSQTLAALAACRETRLEGWLLGLPSEPADANAATSEEHSTGGQSSRSRSELASPVFARLDSLVERIDRLRQEIQDFDVHLAERRHVFRVGEEIDNAVAGVVVRRSNDCQDRKLSGQRDATAIASISERLQASSDVSRSTSPRGRRQEDVSDNSHAVPKFLVGRLNHLRLSPSPSGSNRSERTYSPSPLRKQSTSSTASSAIPPPRGPPNALLQRVRLNVTSRKSRQPRESEDSESSSLRSEAVTAGSGMAEDEEEVSLSHLLTNVIILQEFILELAAIIQVRASLFSE